MSEFRSIKGISIFNAARDITTPEAAVKVIIEGLGNNRLRMLVGDSAKEMAELVRQDPDQYLEMLAASGTPFFCTLKR